MNETDEEHSHDLWVLAIIAVLAVLLVSIAAWPNLSLSDSRGEIDTRAEQYRPGGAQCQPAAIAALADINYRTAKAEACADIAERDRQNRENLEYQRRIAQAATDQVTVTARGVWIAWVQAIGGALTMVAAGAAAFYARRAAREGTRAANEGNRAANEAGKANDLTRQMIAESKRAWLKWRGEPQVGLSYYAHGYYQVDVSCPLENVGASIARAVEILGKAVIYPVAGPDLLETVADTVPYVRISDARLKGTMFPGDLQGIILTPPTLGQQVPLNEPHRIVVFCTATYRLPLDRSDTPKRESTLVFELISHSTGGNIFYAPHDPLRDQVIAVGFTHLTVGDIGNRALFT